MIIEYCKKRYLISSDWLSFSVKLNNEYTEPTAPKGYRLELYDGNNIFKKRAILFDDIGRKLFTLLWCPYSSVLDSRIATCQISNECLYYGEELFNLNLLYKTIPCVFNSFSRIDFAIDFETNNNIMATIRKLYNGSYYVQGKQQGSIWWHNSTFRGERSRVPHCLNWGGSESKIKVKLYNKSREQNQDKEFEKDRIADKEYIVNKWRMAGFDVAKVWRLEFSFTSTGTMLWNNELIDWDKYMSNEWRWNVVLAMYTKRFIVRQNQGKRSGHKNEDKIVKFLNLPKNECDRIKYIEREEKKECNSMISAIRRIANEMTRETAVCNDDIFASLADTLYTMVRVGRLDNYFVKTFGCDVNEWIQQQYISVGSGVIKQDLKPSMRDWD